MLSEYFVLVLVVVLVLEFWRAEHRSDGVWEYWSTALQQLGYFCRSPRSEGFQYVR